MPAPHGPPPGLPPSTPPPRPRARPAALRIGDLAAAALVEEASLPGKPGLVGPEGRGAHEDMDLALMLASAEVLRPYFAACAEQALAEDGAEPRALFARLRPLGLAAEKEMYRVTGGVNTHKGAVFSLGLLSAAAALESGAGRTGLAERVLERAAAMAGGLVAELERPRGEGGESAGERLHRELGASGARGQAEAGFPVLARRVLPPLRRARSAAEADPAAREAALLEALLGAMAELEDTCVLSRGGPAGLALVREGAAAVLAAWSPRGPGPEARAALAAFSALLEEKRLSPGGSADLLAAGIFLDALESSRD